MNAFDPSISRRRALKLAGMGAVGSLVATRVPFIGSAAASITDAASPIMMDDVSSLPKRHMEKILRTDGTVSNGVLQFGFDRDDLHVTGPHGVPFKPAFQLDGAFCFQALGKGKAIMNGDMALLSKELNPFLDALLANGLVFQAQHQHFFDLDPMVWFIHTRGVGEPLALAEAVRRAIATTATPLPQHAPAHPTTPLDAKRIGEILGGDAVVGADGTVTVDLARREKLVLDGVTINPFLNVMTNVVFQPLAGGSEQHCAVGPDFGMIASEVDPLCSRMRSHGFEVHCLYNQETDENPQLFFSHQFATGHALELASKVRDGLDLLNLALR